MSSTSSASGTSSFEVGGLGWVGNCLVSLGGKGWGTDAWPVVRMEDGGSPADECRLSSALSFPYTSRTPSVPVFTIPIGPIVSHTLYPFVPLISHINDTHASTA